MKLFDGLYPYELVLLALGVLLFLVLILAFVMLLMRKQPYGKFLMFFAIPIIMIGFPGIKSIEISGELGKIGIIIQDLEKSPTDKKLRAGLEQAVANVSARPIADPRASTTIARAQLALGNDAAAEARIEKALKEAPQLPAALELKKRIELVRKLADFTSQVKQNPSNATAKANLKATVKEVTQLPIASPETMTNVAQAQKVLGDQAEAKDYVDKALKIKPNMAPAIQLKRQIQIPPTPAGADNR